jgi:hypothetical protein
MPHLRAVRRLRATAPAVLAGGLAVLLVVCLPFAAAAAGQSDFARFWASFRAAALADDRDAIVAMSRFPFAVKGQLDDEPAELVDAAEFRRRLPDLLLQDVGISPQPQPMLEYIERTEHPAQAGAEAVQVGQFEFVLQPDGWRFAGAYVDR